MWFVLINWPIPRVLNLCSEELLIDFRELIGSHSGENLAAAIWETLELYGLQGRVSSSLNQFNFAAYICHCLSESVCYSVFADCVYRSLPSTAIMLQTTTQ
jgi:hypothetical protein